MFTAQRERPEMWHARRTAWTLAVALSMSLVGACGSGDASTDADDDAVGEVAVDPGGQSAPPDQVEVTGTMADPTGSLEEPTGSLVASGASCVADYSPDELAERAFAFDGTVTQIGPATTNRGGEGDLEYAGVTFTVAEWFAGGEASTITVDMTQAYGSATDTSISSSDSAETPSFDVGTRLLVSGEPRWGGAALDDPIAWSCGFTQVFDEQTAQEWREANGS